MQSLLLDSGAGESWEAKEPNATLQLQLPVSEGMGAHL